MKNNWSKIPDVREGNLGGVHYPGDEHYRCCNDCWSVVHERYLRAHEMWHESEEHKHQMN